MELRDLERHATLEQALRCAICQAPSFRVHEEDVRKRGVDQLEPRVCDDLIRARGGDRRARQGEWINRIPNGLRRSLPGVLTG